jgi:hypothetical protein
VRRALSAVFKGAVGKDVVSRTWRKVKGDWDVRWHVTMRFWKFSRNMAVIHETKSI